MTPAEHHEFQLLRMALILDRTNKTAAQVLRDAAEFIRNSASDERA